MKIVPPWMGRPGQSDDHDAEPPPDGVQLAIEHAHNVAQLMEILEPVTATGRRTASPDLYSLAHWILSVAKPAARDGGRWTGPEDRRG
jgi:hypothetical protein